MPLQGLVTADAIRRTHRYAAVGEWQKIAFNPVGQVVGQINHVEKSRDVITRLLTEFVDAIDHLNSILPE